MCNIIGFLGKTSTAFIISKIFQKNLIKSCFFTDLNEKLLDVTNSEITKKKNPRNDNIKGKTTINKKYTPSSKIMNSYSMYNKTKTLLSNGIRLLFHEINTKTLDYEISRTPSPQVIILTTHEERLLNDHQHYFFLKNKQILINNIFLKHNLLILNADDNFCNSSRFLFPYIYIFEYSYMNNTSQIFANKIIYSIWGTQIYVDTPNESFLIETRLIGKHNVYNILAAVALSLSFNIPTSYIISGLEDVMDIPNRLEKIDKGHNFCVAIDFSSTPETILSLIKSLYQSCRCQILLLSGGRGENPEKFNKKIGSEIFYATKKLILTVTNPKWCTPSELFNEIIRGISYDKTYAHVGSVYNWLSDQRKIPLWFEFWFNLYQNDLNCFFIKERYLAIRAIVAMAKKDDIVVISGKGDLDFIDIMDTTGKVHKFYFNDKLETSEALKYLSSIYSSTLKTKTIPWKIK
mmetsp:Transcript_18380/g.27517  ORF Transcript_18380/g.27517 Transcript_18380/m.27517 type:complete len:462 (+) Transcript_18380:411-1796(+)